MTQETASESYESVLAKAKSVFPNAEVTASDGQWVINTGVEELREPDESWRGTPAEDAHNTYEASYGSDLERWAYKNGFGYASLHEAALAYNASIVAHHEEMERLCEKLIAEGKQDIVDAYRNGTLIEYHREKKADEATNQTEEDHR